MSRTEGFVAFGCTTVQCCEFGECRPLPARAVLTPAAGGMITPAPVFMVATSAPATSSALVPTQPSTAEDTVALATVPPIGIAPRLSGAPIKLTPGQIVASSTAPPSKDDQGRTISYNVENALDGQPDTAWRTPGDASGQSLTISFAQPIILSDIQIIPGYAKSDQASGVNRFRQNRRIRTIRFGFSDGTQHTAMFDDAPTLQSAGMPLTKTSFVRLVIIETRPPAARDGRDFSPISEIVVMGELSS